MVWSVLFQPAGAVALVVGAVRSILTAGLLAVVLLPALSLTVWVAVRFSPSPVMALFAGAAVASPESASSAVHAMTTSPLYQPLVGCVVGAPLRVGAVLSTLTPLTVALVH